MAEPIKIHAGQVEMVPLTALRGYQKNSRAHPPSQIDAIANMVREFGWTTPLLIGDDDEVVAGHGRIEVAKKLKLTEVPCVRVSGLTADQRRALRIADNKAPELGGWLEDMLRIELADLKGVGFDLSLTGFDTADLSKLFATNEGQTDPDEVPAVPVQPISQLGDLWRLGEHWLICGDSTDPATVERVLGGSKPHLMVTDPPYGVEYDPSWREEAAKKGLIGFSPSALGKVKNDGRIDWREAWALFPGEVVYCWHADRHASAVQASLESVGLEMRSQIIWGKSSFAISRGHYHWQHEPCWYAVKKGGKGHWNGDRSQSTLWSIPHVKNETGHGTQKPIECMRRPLENSSAAGDHVYEPFNGSGSLLIAAQMTKRVAHCVELDPAYIDVACKRFADFSGIAPILAETGETFEQVRARRLEVV